MKKKCVLLAMMLLVLPLLLGAGRKTSILQTRHNLSVSGKGEITSPSETRVCIFCHSSHNAGADGPLWNHLTTSPGQFKTYDRSTMAAKAEQPNGATKLCLSCHDGTVAVGAIRGLSRPIPMRNVGAGGEIPVHRSSNLGTDLTGTHPVSVKFQPDLSLGKRGLKWPPNDPEGSVGVDADGYVQCTSCHDPHGSASDAYPFWQKQSFSEVCQVCHEY
jgi:predicted CXXCH cytochrome family protein